MPTLRSRVLPSTLQVSSPSSSSVSETTTPSATPSPVERPLPTHCLPIHTKPTRSPLTPPLAPQSYRGLQNLAHLLLLAEIGRLFIENLHKYGVLIHWPRAQWGSAEVTIVVGTYIPAIAHILIANTIEKTSLAGLQKNSNILPTNRRRTAAHLINISSMLILNLTLIFYAMAQPLVGVLVVSCTVVLALKLTSYALVNRSLRDQYCSTDKSSPYPDNPFPESLSLKNVFYFYAAPTLCYQPSYPPSPQPFRHRFVLSKLLEIAAGLTIMYMLIEQYVAPLLGNSLQPIKLGQMTHVLERTLKLSFVSCVIWLLGFYILFHSWLNVVAEILNFGDREFYRPWWNAHSAEEYWRLWNIPVYNWMKRHVYLPLSVNQKLPRGVSLGIAFVISALAHEIIIAFPTRIFTGWAFAGMLGQIPLVQVGRLIIKWRGPDTAIGNCVFWLTFVVFGQPICVILYYSAWSLNMFTVPP